MKLNFTMRFNFSSDYYFVKMKIYLRSNCVRALSQISINVYLAQLDIVEGFSGPVVMDRNPK